MERKNVNGTDTWDCTSVPNWQSLTSDNFYGCNISGVIYIYGSWTPAWATSYSYNNTTGILTVSIHVWNTTDGTVSFYPSPTANIQPIVII